MDIKEAQYYRYESTNIGVKVTTNSDKILWVPLTTANSDYIAVLEWVDEGNTIEEAD
jgi:hypothetical protein